MAPGLPLWILFMKYLSITASLHSHLFPRIFSLRPWTTMPLHQNMRACISFFKREYTQNPWYRFFVFCRVVEQKTGGGPWRPFPFDIAFSASPGWVRAPRLAPQYACSYKNADAVPSRQSVKDCPGVHSSYFICSRQSPPLRSLPDSVIWRSRVTWASFCKDHTPTSSMLTAIQWIFPGFASDTDRADMKMAVITEHLGLSWAGESGNADRKKKNPHLPNHMTLPPGWARVKGVQPLLHDLLCTHLISNTIGQQYRAVSFLPLPHLSVFPVSIENKHCPYFISRVLKTQGETPFILQPRQVEHQPKPSGAPAEHRQEFRNPKSWALCSKQKGTILHATWILCFLLLFIYLNFSQQKLLSEFISTFKFCLFQSLIRRTVLQGRLGGY